MKVKQILALVLALVMCFALASCGEKKPTDTPSDTPDVTEDAPQGDVSFEKEGVIKLGGIGPITGDLAQYGVAVQLGAELAVAEINAAGGINGYEVAFKMEDDTGAADIAVNAYNALKDWGMQTLVGTVTSTPCVAVSAEAVNDNMLLLTPSGSSIDAISAGDTCFRVCFSDDNQGIVAADYIADKGLATKVGVIFNSSDSYSTGIKDNLVAEAAKKGLEIVATEAFTNDNATDFSAQLNNVKDAGAELVFLSMYYTPASLLLKQAKDMGYAPIFFGPDGMDGILGMENFDTSLAEGLRYLTPFLENATDDATVKFVESFKAKYPDRASYLNQFAADAYDAIYALKAAYELADVTPETSVSDAGNLLKDALTKVSVDGVTGTAMVWSADGEPQKQPRVAIINNGVVEAA
ncbi:MAG: ABC transporter substrate-binding protein [Clostridia bacterium]|nr:ABC transporter substrate-binding protein [Clostridia bacterium]MBR5426966.1 ABC transporter substrate-binding protein [Clostridia bacterium]